VSADRSPKTGATARLRVRTAGDGDIEAVCACLAAAFEPYRATYTRGAFLDTVPDRDGIARRLREMTVLVAEATTADAATRFAGTIAYQVSESGVGHLRGMAVPPDFQGRGVAERLLEEAEAGLLAQGCTRVTLDTTRPLERAIRFYERLGYRPTGMVTDFHGMPLYEYAKAIGG